MKVAIIGRSEILYNSALAVRDKGHDIVLIITAEKAPEYTRSPADFQALADQWGIPCLKTSRIFEVKATILSAQPDIGVSINYSGIIPQEVIDLFPHGILNAHAGDLPRYRGNACPAWAIINGEERIGLCIHKMIGGELDCGDIIAREYMPITINTKVTQTWEWMKEQVPVLFLKAIQRLEQDKDHILERQSNNPKDALRCYPRKPEDGKIDWTQSAEAILRLVNASNKPYAGAFCKYNEATMIIWNAELVLDMENFLAVPGQVTKIDQGSIEVATGKGKLRILKVEFEDKINSPDIFVKSLRDRLK